MKNLHTSSEQGGYIALILVLIVSAASLAIALTMLMTSTDSQRSILVSQQSIQARGSASACAEEALQQIHDNNAFTGTNSLSLSTGSCSYTVTNTGGNNRNIDASATVGNSTRKLKIQVTVQSSGLNLATWQDSS